MKKLILLSMIAATLAPVMAHAGQREVPGLLRTRDFVFKAADQEKAMDNEKAIDTEKAIDHEFGIRDRDSVIRDRDSVVRDRDFNIKAVDGETVITVVRSENGETIVRDRDREIVIRTVSPDGSEN